MTDENDLKYQVYLSERDSLVQAKKETSHNFDKAILALAAGALGLSLAFTKQVAQPQPNTMTYLVISWVLLCSSICTTLISFMTSQNACERQIKIAEEVFLNRQPDSPQKNWPALITRIGNWASIIFFVAGVVVLLLFSVSNILRQGG